MRQIVTASIIAAIMLPMAAIAWAQNEGGCRTLNKTAMQSMRTWYDSTTSSFEVRYPIIRSLPPIDSGMPSDILAAYIYIDSLARFDGSGATIGALQRWTTEGSLNDTLKWMAAYLYKLSDYDPIIFQQYCDQTGLKLHARYRTDLRFVVSALRQAYNVVEQDNPEMPAIYAMLYSPYILRVRVVAIDSMRLKIPGIYSTHLFRVWADVLDTLKGHVFQTCERQTPLATARELQGSSPSSSPCITFNYEHPNYPFPFTMPSGRKPDYPNREPEFLFPVDSGFAMRPGQEAIVFLGYHDELRDSCFDYYNLSVEPQAWNALLIKDGNVRDWNHVWTGEPTQVSLSYEEWKRRFMALRDKVAFSRKAVGCQPE